MNILALFQLLACSKPEFLHLTIYIAGNGENIKVLL